jgi:hypothetical protein
VLEWLIVCLAIVTLNVTADLKDRELYRVYYTSLDVCDGLACLLVSDDLRSPVFLGLIVAAHRFGIGIDVLFIAVSLLGASLLANALRQSPEGQASSRFLLISLALGTWIYLIQVKLFLAIALYLAAHARKHTWVRAALMLAAVLTHESILFLIALHYLWQPSRFAINARWVAAIAVLVAGLVAFVGATTNVVETSMERIAHYNELVSQGEVTSISRTSIVAGLLLLFGLTGVGLNVFGRASLKTMTWMMLPWLVFMALAANEVFALRLSALALLHALLVVPMALWPGHPARLSLVLVTATFGAVTLVKDVLMA